MLWLFLLNRHFEPGIFDRLHNRLVLDRALVASNGEAVARQINRNIRDVFAPPATDP